MRSANFRCFQTLISNFSKTFGECPTLFSGILAVLQAGGQWLNRQPAKWPAASSQLPVEHASNGQHPGRQFAYPQCGIFASLGLRILVTVSSRKTTTRRPTELI
jgi:hypothetical protein